MQGVSQHLPDHLRPMVSWGHFYNHHPTPAFLFIFSTFFLFTSPFSISPSLQIPHHLPSDSPLPVSCFSNSPDMKAAAQWSCHLLPSSPSDVVSAGNYDIWPCVDCLIRPRVFQEIIQHYIFYYMPPQISTAKLLIFSCYCFIVIIIKIASSPFHSVVIFYSALLDSCFPVVFFSKFHYLCVLCSACSPLFSQHILLPQQHVY